MSTQTQASAVAGQDISVEREIQRFRDFFADAPELGRKMQTQTLDNCEHDQIADHYDGEWDSCNDDFATQIPDYLEIMQSARDGRRNPGAKDYLGNFQITAEGW